MVRIYLVKMNARPSRLRPYRLRIHVLGLGLQLSVYRKSNRQLHAMKPIKSRGRCTENISFRDIPGWRPYDKAASTRADAHWLVRYAPKAPSRPPGDTPPGRLRAK